MARITKEIKELIADYEYYDHTRGFAEEQMEKIRHKLITLGMTEDQLEQRGIFPDWMT